MDGVLSIVAARASTTVIAVQVKSPGSRSEPAPQNEASSSSARAGRSDWAVERAGAARRA